MQLVVRQIYKDKYQNTENGYLYREEGNKVERTRIQATFFA